MRFLLLQASVRLVAAFFLLTGLNLAVSSAGASQPAGAPMPSMVDSAWLSVQQAIQQQLTSIDKQRQSIHQQLGEPVNARSIRVADFIDPWPALLPAYCPALDREYVDALTKEAAREQALSADLLRAVMKRESAFKPCAVSGRGAQGLMQLMPATAQQFHVTDPFDPSQNVLAGAAYLKQLLARYKGDLKLALAAYNAGPVRADQQANRPFPIETQNYLTGILADMGVGHQISIAAVEVPEATSLELPVPAEPPKPE